MSVCVPFWEVPANCGKAKGELEDGVPLSIFFESAFVASRCVTDLKPTPQVKGSR